MYHKRRVSWRKFYQQVHKFGMVRPILNSWHPSTKKITYWFPTLFSLGFVLALLLWLFQINGPILIYISYFMVAYIMAFIKTKSIVVSLLALIAIGIQFVGYGYGFLKSTVAITILRKNPEVHFPNLFFKLR